MNRTPLDGAPVRLLSSYEFDVVLYVNVLPSATVGMTASGADTESAGTAASRAASRWAAQAGKPLAARATLGRVAATSDGAPMPGAPTVIFSPSTSMLCMAGLSSRALMISSVFWLRSTGSNGVDSLQAVRATIAAGTRPPKRRRARKGVIGTAPRGGGGHGAKAITYPI